MSLPQSFEGKFEVLHKISEGGMGAVYKVRHVLLDEVRVIKVVRPQHADDENLKARFHREARTATRLRHPNIAVMHDFSIDESGTAYIVMEYIDGKTVHQVLAEGGPPPLAETLEIARQSLDALSYLHGEGYVHRDISPDNLMLTQGPRDKLLVKLIDLGVAKRVGGGHQLTSTGMFLGKVRYSSPEQFSGVELDARSDVYSFGVMLYELLTGRIPIQGEDFSSFIGGHLYRSPISFDVSDPEGRIPAGLRQVVMKTLEKQAENRVGSAEELAAMLAPYGENAAAHRTIAIDEQQETVLLPGGEATSLPTGLVSEAMQRIDRLLDAGRLEEAERQLTETIAELGEVEYLRGLREKLERARARSPTQSAALAEPTLSAAAPDATSAAGEARPRSAMRWIAGLLAFAIVAGGVFWALSQRTVPGSVATGVKSEGASTSAGDASVPIDEATYLMVRDRIEAGDVAGVRRMLRKVIEADPTEQARRQWVTPGEDGPYLPHFYLGLASALANDCVAALDAWDESERQGEVQKAAAEHARVVEGRSQCNALYAGAVARSEKRLEEAASYVEVLETALAGSDFDDIWRESPELRRDIEAALDNYQALASSFEQARGAGFGALILLETDVLDAASRLQALTDQVLAVGEM